MRNFLHTNIKTVQMKGKREMRLALFTNIPSHYQISLNQAFAERLPGKFAMVCWESGMEDRKQLGWWEDYEYPWLVKAWKSAEEYTRAIDILRSAEIVIWGYAPEEEIATRVARNKLTFRYTERFFKRGRWRILDPRVLRAALQIHGSSRHRAHHLLAVGPYCASDYRLLRSFPGRMWRWGYFPQVPDRLNRKESGDEMVILWAGRMLDLKRVDLLLEGAAWARAEGSGHFRVRLIGYGPEEERLRALARRLGLADSCEFLGPMSPEDVWKAMEQADIYVFPSNQQEGWGAVVNEAMSYGCCVIGSQSAGSVPWLIRDGMNGYIFCGHSAEKLGRILLRCLESPARTREMGVAAHNTMVSLWSPQVAAERFLQLCDALEAGKPPSFGDGGPCSPA